MKISVKERETHKVIKRFAIFPYWDYPSRTLIWFETYYVVRFYGPIDYGSDWQTDRLATKQEYIDYKNKSN